MSKLVIKIVCSIYITLFHLQRININLKRSEMLKKIVDVIRNKYVALSTAAYAVYEAVKALIDIWQLPV